MVEMLVGLDVTDEAAYSAYRAAMMPILTFYGGSFGYDFVVSKVLQSETNAEINRVFTIRFPDDEMMDQFFSDADYVRVKAQHFESSVRNTTILARYEKETS